MAYLGYKRCIEIEFVPPDSWNETPNGDGTFTMTANTTGADIKIVKQGGEPQLHADVPIGSYVDWIGPNSDVVKVRVF